MHNETRSASHDVVTKGNRYCLYQMRLVARLIRFASSLLAFTKAIRAQLPLCEASRRKQSRDDEMPLPHIQVPATKDKSADGEEKVSVLS